VAIVGVLTGVLLLGFIGIAIWCLRRQKERVSKSGAYDLPPESGKSVNTAIVSSVN